MNSSVTAEAGANIAFIKYWGNRPEGGNLPLNPSLSMTLAACVTSTAVELVDSLSGDEFSLDGCALNEKSQKRIAQFMDVIRAIVGRKESARIRAKNSFPTGCGIASSASGFAALALAAATVYGLRPDAAELSRLARLGSGSAARSVMGGFVQLLPGATHEESFAEQVAPVEAWPDLRDVIVVVSQEEKAVSSAEGHRLARTSEMLAARLAAVPERIERVRKAIHSRDLTLLGEASEEDALSMYAVMMTSKPPLLYWHPRTIEVIRAVQEMRGKDLEAYFTIDAGPNVHVLTLEKDLSAVEKALRERFDCKMIVDRAGAGARIVEADCS